MLPIKRTITAASIVSALLLCSACGQPDVRDTEGQRASFEGHALVVSPTADLLDGQGLTVRLSGFPPDTPLDALADDRTFTHATEYSVSDYMHWSDLAARFDYTLEELQKTGALFWAWLATGRPPLPT